MACKAWKPCTGEVSWVAYLKRAEQSEVSYQGGLKAGDVCPSVGGSVNVFMKGGN